MCDNNEYTEIDMDNWKDYTKLLLMTNDHAHGAEQNHVGIEAVFRQVGERKKTTGFIKKNQSMAKYSPVKYLGKI